MDKLSTYKFLPPELADRLRDQEIKVKKAVEGLYQGGHKSTNYGASVEFAEYRQYTRGDPPNLIDWAVYARSDRYMVRKFHKEVNIKGYILLDISESLAYKEQGLMTKMDYACFLAAGIIYVLINQQDSAGLITFDDKIRAHYDAVSSLDNIFPLLGELEKIKPTTMGDIESALHEAAERINHKSMVVIISDLLQSPEKIINGIRHLGFNGHDIAILHILDTSELRLNFSGVTELRELETGNRIIINPDDIRERYAYQVDQYLDTLRRGCTDVAANYYLVDTRLPIEETIYSWISNRT